MTFNGFVIFAALAVIHLMGKVSTTDAAIRRQQQQQSEFAQGMEEGRRSTMDFGGWIGRGSTPSAMVGVMSLDDHSPTARRLLNDLPVPCSVLGIAARPAPGCRNVELEPSSLTMEFADGHLVHALDGARILGAARNDPQHVLLRFNSAFHTDPAQDMYQSFALIPAGTDVRKLRSVTFRMNGEEITVRGSFLSPEQKQAMGAGN